MTKSDRDIRYEERDIFTRYFKALKEYESKNYANATFGEFLGSGGRAEQRPFDLGNREAVAKQDPAIGEAFSNLFQKHIDLVNGSIKDKLPFDHETINKLADLFQTIVHYLKVSIADLCKPSGNESDEANKKRVNEQNQACNDAALNYLFNITSQSTKDLEKQQREKQIFLNILGSIYSESNPVSSFHERMQNEINDRVKGVPPQLPQPRQLIHYLNLVPEEQFKAMLEQAFLNCQVTTDTSETKAYQPFLTALKQISESAREDDPYVTKKLQRLNKIVSKVEEMIEDTQNKKRSGAVSYDSHSVFNSQKKQLVVTPTEVPNSPASRRKKE